MRHHKIFMPLACAGLVISFFCAAPSAASAKTYMTGQELRTMCSSKFNTDYGMCAGFVTGIADVLLQQKVDGIKACHMTTVKTQQLMTLVTKYIDKHPEMLSEPARYAVAKALENSFFCE